MLCTLFALSFRAEAQQKIPRIGFLSRELHPSDSRASFPHNRNAFLQGLRELGYIEGKNILIEDRYADLRFERVPALAEELIRLKADIILADTSTSARAAKKVTTTVPIVITSGSDPILSGLVTSLARPGGNVTGLTNYSAQLLGKRLGLLKEVTPKASRFALLEAEGGRGATKAMIPDAEAAAHGLGVKLDFIELKSPNPAIEDAFRSIVKEHIEGVITGAAILTLSLNRHRILELLSENRIPAIHPTSVWIDDGGLMYYGASIPDLYRRAATYVDKILKGAKPADLPVEQPTKFELVINLKTAKQIGLTIPPNVLARADKVIK
jgi:putative ABC transport system substrate-binding protein